MIKERNFGKCDSVSSASSRRALEHIVPGGHREVLQWDRVRVKPLLLHNFNTYIITQIVKISLKIIGNYVT